MTMTISFERLRCHALQRAPTYVISQDFPVVD